MSEQRARTRTAETDTAVEPLGMRVFYVDQQCGAARIRPPGTLDHGAQERRAGTRASEQRVDAYRVEIELSGTGLVLDGQGAEPNLSRSISSTGPRNSSRHAPS